MSKNIEQSFLKKTRLNLELTDFYVKDCFKNIFSEFRNKIPNTMNYPIKPLKSLNPIKNIILQFQVKSVQFPRNPSPQFVPFYITKSVILPQFPFSFVIQHKKDISWYRLR